MTEAKCNPTVRKIKRPNARYYYNFPEIASFADAERIYNTTAPVRTKSGRLHDIRPLVRRDTPRDRIVKLDEDAYGILVYSYPYLHRIKRLQPLTPQQLASVSSLIWRRDGSISIVMPTYDSWAPRAALRELLPPGIEPVVVSTSAMRAVLMLRIRTPEGVVLRRVARRALSGDGADRTRGLVPMLAQDRLVLHPAGDGVWAEAAPQSAVLPHLVCDAPAWEAARIQVSEIVNWAFLMMPVLYGDTDRRRGSVAAAQLGARLNLSTEAQGVLLRAAMADFIMPAHMPDWSWAGLADRTKAQQDTKAWRDFLRPMIETGEKSLLFVLMAADAYSHARGAALRHIWSELSGRWLPVEPDPDKIAAAARRRLRCMLRSVYMGISFRRVE